MNDIDAFYDNSNAFSKYWKSRGGADVKFQLRTVHRIIPHVRDFVYNVRDGLRALNLDSDCKLPLKLNWTLFLNSPTMKRGIVTFVDPFYQRRANP